MPPGTNLYAPFLYDLNFLKGWLYCTYIECWIQLHGRMSQLPILSISLWSYFSCSFTLYLSINWRQIEGLNSTQVHCFRQGHFRREDITFTLFLRGRGHSLSNCPRGDKVTPVTPSPSTEGHMSSFRTCYWCSDFLPPCQFPTKPQRKTF